MQSPKVKLFQKSILFLYVILIQITSGSNALLLEERYVQVMKTRVNIRHENSVLSIIVAKARKGDIFKLASEKRNWYEVVIFSGEYRYIHKTLGKEISYFPSLPKSESIRREIFRELIEAKEQAMIDANKKLPANINNKIDYSRILEDRYKLEMFHRYQIQSPIYWQLISEGARKGWENIKLF